MTYRSLRACVNDLRNTQQLIEIQQEVDPNLAMAEIHRRVYEAKGPALLFKNVKGSPFEAVSNIYGTFERTEYLFRDTLKKVQQVVQLKADPSRLLKSPFKYAGAGLTALTGLPKKIAFPRASDAWADYDQCATTDYFLARRRRSLYHITTGLDPRPGRCFDDAIKCRDVSHPTQRQRIHTGRRDRLALPNPSGHRCASHNV